jgi:hypothetical protein
MRGGYFSLSKAYVEQTPILLKGFDNTLKNKVMELYDFKNSNLKSDTSQLEKEIDQLVYQLYGLTEEEIEIIQTSI